MEKRSRRSIHKIKKNSKKKVRVFLKNINLYLFLEWWDKESSKKTLEKKELNKKSDVDEQNDLRSQDSIENTSENGVEENPIEDDQQD